MTMTYGQIQSALQAALVEALPADDDDHYVWVYDFSDAFVIYCCDSEYLQDSYTIDDGGNVSLTGAPVAVRPVTTYEPVGETGRSQVQVRFEVRAGSDPSRIAREIVGHLRQDAPVRVKSEPLTYHRHAPHSFYRDVALQGRDRAASERLARHRQETDVLSRSRTERAWRSLHAGEVEYRVEPNRTDGQGGYFSPPAWLNDLFGTAKRPGRVLSALIPGRFDLPDGVSSVNVPVINAGTTVQPASDLQAVSDTDITDLAGSSTVATLAGQADVALQMLEQSPAGAHLDYVLFTDLTAGVDYDLDTQLINGAGSAFSQLLGVLNVDNQSTAVTYTSGTPTGSALWPFLGQAAGQLGDSRLRPPEAWLMRTARWAWLNAAEDTANRPFSLPSPFFMGNTPDTPDPVGGMYGWPTFLTDAIPANLGAGANQDVVICLRPSDLLLFESAPTTAVVEDFGGSGNLSVRLRLHCRAAAITRYTSGVAIVSGTGMAVSASF